MAVTIGIPEAGVGKVTALETFFEAKRVDNWLKYNYNGVGLAEYARETVMGDHISDKDLHDEEL